jgi:hypothetical protein
MNKYDLDQADYEALRVKPATMESVLAELLILSERLEEHRAKDKLIPERVQVQMLIDNVRLAVREGAMPKAEGRNE